MQFLVCRRPVWKGIPFKMMEIFSPRPSKDVKFQPKKVCFWWGFFEAQISDPWRIQITYNLSTKSSMMRLENPLRTTICIVDLPLPAIFGLQAKTQKCWHVLRHSRSTQACLFKQCWGQVLLFRSAITLLDGIRSFVFFILYFRSGKKCWNFGNLEIKGFTISTSHWQKSGFPHHGEHHRKNTRRQETPKLAVG